MDEKGKKYDLGKPPMDLIPAEAEIEEAHVWGFGAMKYGRHNFRKGITYSQLIAAAKRHINAIQRGEDYDYDLDCMDCNNGNCKMHSGRKHWACVRCCMGMLAVMEIEHPELDDRYKK